MKNENFDFSKKSNTRRGFTVIGLGRKYVLYLHFFIRRVVRFPESGMTNKHVVGFQKEDTANGSLAHEPHEVVRIN